VAHIGAMVMVELFALPKEWLRESDQRATAWIFSDVPGEREKIDLLKVDGTWANRLKQLR
jgi:hypothetical protein